MAAYGLYTHIASNKVRSMLLLAGLFLLIYVVVYAGALLAEVAVNSTRSVDYYLMAAARDLMMAFPYATGAAALWIVIAYFFHQNMIDAVTGGEDVTRKQQPRLYNLLENLCVSRGIPMPKLKIMDSDARNAFASGLNRRQYAITVTSGLIKALNDQELEAVLGHELTHIRNGDVQLMVTAVIIAGVVGFFGELFFRMFTNLSWNSSSSSSSSSRSSSSSSDSNSKGGGGGAVGVVIIAVVLILLAWLLSQVVKLALSRSRELLADAGSVELTKNPDAMISALRKIENRGELPGATSAVMELCIDNPREGFADLFATHPSVDSRVQALVKYAGGRDSGRLALPSDTEAAPDDD
jgi:heat shock protein HtpX